MTARRATPHPDVERADVEREGPARRGIGGRVLGTLALLAIGGLVLAGCPLKFEKEPGSSIPPVTFFETSPPDTSFSNLVRYVWLGTDQDSDVVAYQYQFVQTDSLYYVTGGLEGRVIRSLDPRREFLPGEDTTLWSPRVTTNFQTFPDLDDGWFEMRVRAIDDDGNADPTPAIQRVFVFFDDRPPFPQILVPCGRLDGQTSYAFLCDAADSSRRGIPTPRTSIEYSYQLRATSTTTCTSHLSDSFTDWKPFPSTPGPIFIDGSTIRQDGGSGSQYNDLDDAGCRWAFSFRTRDPAGNVATASCEILQNN